MAQIGCADEDYFLTCIGPHPKHLAAAGKQTRDRYDNTTIVQSAPSDAWKHVAAGIKALVEILSKSDLMPS